MTKAETCTKICEAYEGLNAPLLPILHAVQEEFGCIDAEAEAAVAAALNLSRAEVHGVVSFYHDFRADHDPRPEVQICRAEACQARGVESLIDAAEQAAGSRVKLTTVYCLGLCSTGPNVRIGDRLHSRLGIERLCGLIDSL